MRVVSLHHDALVVTSRMWMTNAVALRAGDEAMLVDSPYFPDELEALPAVLSQSAFELSALIATHGDFDHLLGRAAFPSLALGVADSTSERLRSDPGGAQRDLRDHDASIYVERSAPLSLGRIQSLPVPGELELGEEELELHPAEGHTVDGVAVFAPFCGVLVCGDYLSDVEIPTISPGGSLDGYRSTLARLRGVVERSEAVVPGHGSVLSRDRALQILDEDLAYLDALELGKEAVELPAGRDTPHQRALHQENLRV